MQRIYATLTNLVRLVELVFGKLPPKLALVASINT